MSALNRRQWLQRSLLASSAVLLSSHTNLLNQAVGELKNPDHPLLRLNWNENPLGPPKSAVKAVTEALVEANRYPDFKIAALKKKLAQRHQVNEDELMITAGSTELLSLLGQHVGLQKGQILTPWPSFPTLIRFGELSGATIKKVDLNSQGVIDLEALKQAISQNTTLIFLCNPNNPPSTEVRHEELVEFCKMVPSGVLLCVDEAYIQYSEKGEAGSVIKLIRDMPNLVVCRTFSKAYGLAGLRIGYGLSQKANIDALRSRHLGFELSAGIAPVTGAMAALDDSKFLQQCIDANQKGRQILYNAFDKWGVVYNKSATNFVYAKSDRFHQEVVAKLRKEEVLISQWPGIMTGHIRISIGKEQEMHQFVEAVEKYLI